MPLLARTKKKGEEKEKEKESGETGENTEERIARRAVAASLCDLFEGS